MKTLYLILAVVGGVIPYIFLIQWLLTEGIHPGRFIAALFVNPAAACFTLDALLSSVVFWIFIIHQRRRQKGPHPVLFIVINFVIGLCCALATYLYVRERRANKTA
jgi:hypothetical protein